MCLPTGKSVTTSSPGAPDENGYFTEPSTPDGSDPSPGNPTIPGGFKPLDDGDATWGDGGTPPENSVDQGLVVENPDLGQFVWIPVSDINSMVMCKQNKSGSLCSIVKDDSTGKLKCATHNSDDLCGKLYATSTGESFNASLTNQTYAQNSGLREPDLVTQYDSSYLSNMGLSSTTDFQNQMKNDFMTMALSTYNCKGFWMGRFETSWGSNGVTSKKNVASTSAGSGNTSMWYGLYKQQRVDGKKPDTPDKTIYHAHMYWRMPVGSNDEVDEYKWNRRKIKKPKRCVYRKPNQKQKYRSKDRFNRQ